MLYVAMTRAKEKLILTAVASDLEKKVSGYAAWQPAWAGGVPYGQLASARSFLDWILAALSRSWCFAPLYHMAEGAAEPAAGWPYDSEAETPPIRIQVLTPAQMTLSQMEYRLGRSWPWNGWRRQSGKIRTEKSPNFCGGRKPTVIHTNIWPPFRPR